MIDLVLHRSGTQPSIDLVEVVAMAVPCRDADVHEAVEVAADRDTQAAFVVEKRDPVERLDVWVNQYRQR